MLTVLGLDMPGHGMEEEAAAMEAALGEPPPLRVEAADPAAFLAAVTEFLLAGSEFLFLGLTTMVAAAPAKFAEAQLFVVRRGDQVVMAALRTAASYKFVMTRAGCDGAAAALVEAIAAANPAAPSGLLAPSATSEPAARLLAERYGLPPPTKGIAERYLVAKAVRDPPRGLPAGGLRLVAAAEEPLLAAWCEAFAEDVGVVAAMRKPGAEMVANFAGRLFVWCGGGGGSGEPLCMAGFSGDSQPPGAQRVSMVYTPPEQRKKGYAGAAVHALTAKLLAEGDPHECSGFALRR